MQRVPCFAQRQCAVPLRKPFWSTDWDSLGKHLERAHANCSESFVCNTYFLRPCLAASLSVYKHAECVPVDAALEESAEVHRVVSVITCAALDAQ